VLAVPEVTVLAAWDAGPAAGQLGVVIAVVLDMTMGSFR
jgi:hypothetical protein